MRTAISVLGLVVFASIAEAQQTPYQNRCGECHGAAMTGGSGPSILTYVRYHTDVEVAAAIRDRHQKTPIPLEEPELGQVLATIRKLAGTNQAMATGGFTGRRGGAPGGAPAAPARGAGAGPARGAGAAPSAESSGAGIGGQAATTVKMADGRSKTGILLAQSELSAVLLEKDTFTLLSKDGDAYRPKPITPKSDWTQYDGSLTGNRYSPLELVNRTNVQRIGAAWVFPIASNPRALQSTPVVQDGIMYFTGWNELYAVDATTGRQIWSYGEARHDGILSEGGIGTNRGATISGDKVFIVTDHAHLLGFNRFTGQKLWDAEMGSHLESVQLDVATLAGGRPPGRGRGRW